MRIKRVCYPVNVLGPGNRVGIWVTGCSFNCKGCISPELQNYEAGNEMKIEELAVLLKKISPNIDGFTISGGEPFEQCDELEKLIRMLCSEYGDDIIVYSGYTLKELKNLNLASVNYILDNISVLVDGKYIEEQNTGIGLRGSSNQNIHIFKNKNKYAYMENAARKLQSFDYLSSKSIVVGLI